MEQPKLLSVGEVARRLGLTHWTVRAWVARRQISYYKIGRSVRIPQQEIDRILTAGLHQAKEPVEEVESPAAIEAAIERGVAEVERRIQARLEGARLEGGQE